MFPQSSQTIMTINLQSITNKGTELCNIISSSSPEIIIGTETHLDPTYNNAEILPYDIPSSSCIAFSSESGGLLKDPISIWSLSFGLISIHLISHSVSKSGHSSDFMSGLTIMSTPPSFLSMSSFRSSLSKIKSDKRYRNAKIFFGGDFNPGDINWATGGTISILIIYHGRFFQ
jgi:hypothetical protein